MEDVWNHPATEHARSGGEARNPELQPRVRGALPHPAPPLNPTGRMLRTSQESPKPRICRAPGPPAAPAQPAAVFTPGREPARWGGGGAARPRPTASGPALQRLRTRWGLLDFPTPYAPDSGQPRVCSRLPGWEDKLEGGLPCGERRHGRSCSVNESKCLGDRGLLGSRHAKGGGGGGDKRAGEGGGEKKPELQQQHLLNPGCAPAPESEIKGI